MRILVLVTDAFGGKGGIALYNRDMLTAMCSHTDCEEIVVLPRILSGQLEPLPKRLTYITAAAGNKIKYVLVLLKCVTQHKPFDFILCGHINLLPIAYFVGFAKRIPVILQIYGIDAWEPNKNSIANILAAKVNGVISISEITLKRFLSWCEISKANTYLLPNAIHQGRYGIREKSGTLVDRYRLSDSKIMMTLGRISSDERYKGFDIIIDMLPELIKEIPNLMYIVVGNGDDRLRLINKVADMGLQNHVVFTGYIEEAEKADHYRLADIFVMPSTGEGFGFVFLEAMACGVPVVASKQDGGREAVRDGELGQMVDPNKPDEIKAAILNALKLCSKQIPQGLEYFSFENFSKRLYGILDNVIGKING